MWKLSTAAGFALARGQALRRLAPHIAELPRPPERVEEPGVLGQMLVHGLVADAGLLRRQPRVARRREPFEEHFLARLAEQLAPADARDLHDAVLAWANSRQ